MRCCCWQRTRGGAAAENWRPVGREHGLQVYADVVNGTWCQDNVGIKIVADDARTFADGAIDDTLADVGGKLASSCPRMTGVQVFGEVSPAGQVVYHAIAARAQGWEPMIGKAPTVQQAAVPASMPSTAGGIPSGGSIEDIISGNTLYGQVLPKGSPSRSAYRAKVAAQQARASTIYFARDGTYVERLSRAIGNRESEEFTSRKWSIKGNQLCLSSRCLGVGRRSDGSVDLIGGDGKPYKRYDRIVAGDPEKLVQREVVYAEKVRRSNEAVARIFGALAASGAFNGGGGGARRSPRSL